MMHNLAYLLALHSIEGLGPARLKKLIDYFADPKLAWEGEIKEWENLGTPKDVIRKWSEAKKKLDVENYLGYIEKKGIKVITWFDGTYPEILKEIHDPPLIIYYKGNPEVLNKKALAVVGTRKMSSYGKMATEKITQGLIEAGLVVVSGLARGIDTIAHKTALACGGLTVAVLGGGLSSIYPPENRELAFKIAQTGGAVLSENPPDYPSFAGTFPSRNRIISGLSLGVLVTEATDDSGSLITARLALEQGREVFAVPGPIYSSLSEGPTKLIKEGAKLVSCVEDIFEELNIEKKVINQDISQLSLSEMEKQLINCLSSEQMHVDDLCRLLKVPIFEVSAALIRLEIKNLVKNIGGGVYIKIS